MTEEELQEIEGVLERNYHPGEWGSFTVKRLVKLIRHLQSVIHDQQQESNAFLMGFGKGMEEAVLKVRMRLRGHKERRQRYHISDQHEWAAMNEWQAATLEGLLTDLGSSTFQELSHPNQLREKILTLEEENEKVKKRNKELESQLRLIQAVADNQADLEDEDLLGEMEEILDGPENMVGDDE